MSFINHTSNRSGRMIFGAGFIHGDPHVRACMIQRPTSISFGLQMLHEIRLCGLTFVFSPPHISSQVTYLLERVALFP